MRVTVFLCACDHVFTHFVTDIVRLGTGCLMVHVVVYERNEMEL